jgi:hypothetical protein
MSESCFSKQGIGVPGGTGILAMWPVDMATEDDGESAYILTRIVNSSHVKEQRRIMNNVVLNIRVSDWVHIIAC